MRPAPGTNLRTAGNLLILNCGYRAHGEDNIGMSIFSAPRAVLEILSWLDVNPPDLF